MKHAILIYYHVVAVVMLGISIALILRPSIKDSWATYLPEFQRPFMAMWTERRARRFGVIGVVVSVLGLYYGARAWLGASH